MSAKKMIRWGMIGCGSVAEKKSGPAYQQVEGFELSAVMRRNGELAQDYAHRHGVAISTSSADDIIGDNDIDAVYVATPPDSHVFYGLQVAEAGKICCIEKPLATNYEDALLVCNAFKQRGIALFVAYYRRSLPRFNKVKELLDKQWIGEVRHISWHLNKPASQVDLSKESNWRTDRAVAQGGYFDDLASHGLDLFAYLLGEFLQVKGVAVNQQGLYNSSDAISACWVHKQGVTGAGSWNFGGFSRQDKVVVYGRDGEISFSVFDEPPIVVDSQTMSREFFIENPEHIQLPHVAGMRDHLLGEFNHPSSGATALHTQWVMQQILN
ncbi:MAG: Gfo/Idh/MocA family protein [Arenicella sp.]